MPPATGLGKSYKATNLGCLKLEGLKVTCLFVTLGQTYNRPTKDEKLILTSSLTRRSHLAYTDKEVETISAEIKKLDLKGVLLKSSHEEGEFLSTIFLRPKK